MNGVGDKQMANANAKTIQIKDDANLGIAMLIAEFGEGNYQPVSAVSSINEARNEGFQGASCSPARLRYCAYRCL